MIQKKITIYLYLRTNLPHCSINKKLSFLQDIEKLWQTSHPNIQGLKCKGTVDIHNK